ncbi:MAG TPA: PfkB family carbohydrate kinase, partial [Bryobacteraceae bacterium]
MILTLTINPAIDNNVTADRLVFEDRAYIVASSESPGGRGINASCVIHSFGGQTLAIAPSGGKTGKQFESMLSGCGFRIELVPMDHAIRTNLTITDRQGLTIKLNQPGPALTKKELDRIEDVVRRRLPEADWLMLCGSVPPGVPADYYSKLIRIAKEHRVKTLLDTDGEALIAGVEAGPAVVAPNQQEAERLLGGTLLTRTQFLEAAEKVRKMGAESVVLS